MGLEEIEEQLDEQRSTACRCGTNSGRAENDIQQNLQDYSWNHKNCCIVQM